jgi:hypothetical protein
MTITLDLPPLVEQGLIAKAAARGLSVADYLGEMAAREIVSPVPAAKENAPEQSDKVRGLFTDEEADTLFARAQTCGSDVDCERSADAPSLVKVDGLWVHQGELEPGASWDGIVDDVREERMATVLKADL